MRRFDRLAGRHLLFVCASVFLVGCPETPPPGPSIVDTPLSETEQDAETMVTDEHSVDIERDTKEAFGIACESNSDCPSNFCVPSSEGSVCTEPCVTECPDGWICRPFEIPGSDPTFLCLDRLANLCRPCNANIECRTLGGTDKDRCVDFQEREGSFCTLDCSEGGDCPESYSCENVVEETSGQSFELCMPDSDTCECNMAAIADAAQTDCHDSACTGTRSCTDSGLTECSAQEYGEEICDLADNNCNGQEDEDLGSTTCGLAACEHTVENCVNGVTQECDPLEGATEEICDGDDNDCDGQADNALGSTTCGLAGCEHTIENCVDGSSQECDSFEGAVDEVCDDADNDCDGQVDEGFLNTDGDAQADCVDDDDDDDNIVDPADNCPLLANAPQNNFDNDKQGDVCDDDDDNDDDPDTNDCGPFNAAIHSEAQEVCDNTDNNCNDQTDEGFGSTTCGQGACTHSVDNCVNGKVQICDPYEGATQEICNGVNDDCDSSVDEGLGSTTCGVGACTQQIANCADGKTQICDPFLGAGLEICNGIDDDCDSTVDEGLGSTTCGQGPCIHVVAKCVGGKPLSCDPLEGASEETCNGEDDDCNGTVDDGVLTTFFVDKDQDGYGHPGLTVEACSKTATLATVAGDCNDQDPTVNPGQAEVCDSVDNNCKDGIDEGVQTTFFVDKDQDGYGHPDLTVKACSKTATLATMAGDCNDQAVSVNPGEVEICDGVDNNCNDQTDEGFGSTTCGQGACTHTVENCVNGKVQVCDPDEGATQEICNGVDDDCDGAEDELLGNSTCGVGACTRQIANCAEGEPQICDPFLGAGLESCNGIDDDCDSSVDEGLGSTTCGQGPCIHVVAKCVGGKPLACDPFEGASEETCNGKDDDCDGTVDEGLLTTFFVDKDQDGYGHPDLTVEACSKTATLATMAGDCNDQDPSIHPGHNEVCDQKDNNCDDVIDEGVSEIFWIDNDGDGHGNPDAPIVGCYLVPGMALNSTDCNDADPAIHPDQAEVCDKKDNDCNDQVDDGVATTYYQDFDIDGYGNESSAVVGCSQPSGFVAKGGDCDDTKAWIHEGADENCNNLDDDCDGVIDGHTSLCANQCGTGEETCVQGFFVGCTAPVITKITGTTKLDSPPSSYSFDCLDVTRDLHIAADVTVTVSGFVHVHNYASAIYMAPRSKLLVGGDIRFDAPSSFAATDATIQADGEVVVGQDVQWSLESSSGVYYSGGGGHSCVNGTGSPLHSAGAGGGSRGGDGGTGSACGTAVGSATAGSGGPAASHGSDGVDCQAGNVTPAGGQPSGGSGGAPYSGGGGGGAGGVGGAGSNGYHSGSGTSYTGGNGGLAEAGFPSAPLHGGGGGGAGGWGYCGYYCGSRCYGGGGHGGGILRVRAATFLNQGVIYARGSDGNGGDGGGDVPSSQGGGGGGAGGSLVFHVDSFTNDGLIVATGGAGGTGGPGVTKCGGTFGAGAGGGGGGRIWIGGLEDGSASSTVELGNIQVNGGGGGKTNCNGIPAASGTDGWIYMESETTQGCASGHTDNGDGTCTFTAGISKDCQHANGGAQKYGTSVGWPPPEPGNNWWGSDSPGVVMHAKNTTANGNSKMIGFVPFDATELPVDATVTAAKVRLWANTVNNPDSLALSGQYHEHQGCMGSALYREPISENAMTTMAVSSLTKNGWNEITLKNLGNIQSTGKTAMAFGIAKDGWSPTTDAANNELYFDGKNQTNPAQLVITYKPGTTINVVP